MFHIPVDSDSIVVSSIIGISLSCAFTFSSLETGSTFSGFSSLSDFEVSLSEGDMSEIIDSIFTIEGSNISFSIPRLFSKNSGFE